MTGLAPKTLKVFEKASELSCIKEYVLVGGTALALQINHRLSADLDFCKWVSSTSVKNGIAFTLIEEELKSKFETVRSNPLDFDQADFLIDEEVKFQFFNEVGYNVPTTETINIRANLKIAPIITIAAMKVKTMFQRTAFRDYYDLYAIVKEGHVAINDLLSISRKYDHKLDSKRIINRITSYKEFEEEEEFGTLEPKYEINSEAIGKFFAAEISTSQK